jgi:uncharacterized protein (TIGR00297 family)
MFVLEHVLIVLAMCGILSFLAYWEKVLDKSGSIIGFMVGAIIGIFGDIFWLLLLIFFLFTSFGVTRYRYALKKEIGVQEGKSGERSGKNVLANGFTPTLVAFLSFGDFGLLEKQVAAVIFISAISVSASDTAASEIGVFSNDAYLITKPKIRVKPGTSGGISILGETWALIAGIYTSVVGWLVLLFLPHILGLDGLFEASISITIIIITIPIIVGFIGCQIDSVLGATLEQKGWLSNNGVNLVSSVIGGIIAWLMVVIML